MVSVPGFSGKWSPWRLLLLLRSINVSLAELNRELNPSDSLKKTCSVLCWSYDQSIKIDIMLRVCAKDAKRIHAFHSTDWSEIHILRDISGVFASLRISKNTQNINTFENFRGNVTALWISRKIYWISNDKIFAINKSADEDACDMLFATTYFIYRTILGSVVIPDIAILISIILFRICVQWKKVKINSLYVAKLNELSYDLKVACLLSRLILAKGKKMTERLCGSDDKVVQEQSGFV